jgi:hypothetical protein
LPASEIDRIEARPGVKFSIVGTPALGSVQSGFYEIAFGHARGRKRAARSRRNLRIRADAAGGFNDSACAAEHSVAFLHGFTKPARG